LAVRPHADKMSVMAKRTLAVIALGLLLAGCAARNPVLYPNEQMQRVGSAAAERDIEECKSRAEQYVKDPGRGGDIARDTAIGAGTGAAVGAAVGAVGGNAGRGAAQGAAGGATGGLIHGIFSGSEPSPVYKNFVERCLRERGYEPIGWQ
jgi:outer membrane lipoprotein SlyB